MSTDGHSVISTTPDEYHGKFKNTLGGFSMSRNPLGSEKDDNQRVSDFGQRRTDSTEKLKDQIEDIAARAKDKAGQWTDAASETVDEQRKNVSTGLDRAASTLHEKAGSIPGGPRAVDAAHRVADGMEATASYLRQHDFADMREDVVNICRRHPVQALISAVAVGFLLGRAIRR
jgi:ElaB/YqjD/DUF883 family membrane-anchored ribosome-binding protein